MFVRRVFVDLLYSVLPTKELGGHANMANNQRGVASSSRSVLKRDSLWCIDLEYKFNSGYEGNIKTQYMPFRLSIRLITDANYTAFGITESTWLQRSNWYLLHGNRGCWITHPAPHCAVWK